MGLADALATPDADRKRALGAIADMLDRNAVDWSAIGKIQHAGIHRALTKNADGEAEYHDLPVIRFAPSWDEGPAWPVITPAPMVKLPARKAEKPLPIGNGWRTAVIYPDMQIGYYRNPDGTLEPTHDEAAIAIVHQITRAVRPDAVVFNGDNADFPELSKYRHSPAWQATTQPTINRLGLLCAETRDAARDATVVWLEGNHEMRLSNYILDNARAAFGLKKANMPDAWPSLSLPELCHMDAHDITYLPGYPANVHWLNDRLRIIHGHKVKSGGSTAHLYLNDSKVSTIYGHIHRREWAEKSRQDRDGVKTILAASGGCLARTDGAVPSTNGGMDLDGRPIESAENWQQGCIVVTYQEGDGPFSIELVAIHDGRAIFRGNEFTA